MMIYVKRLVSVDNFKVTLQFTNGEIREVDFEKILFEEQRNPESVFNQLKDPKLFSTVKYDDESETIYWENLTTFMDYDGLSKPGPLDISPEFLYKHSVIKMKEMVH